MTYDFMENEPATSHNKLSVSGQTSPFSIYTDATQARASLPFDRSVQHMPVEMALLALSGVPLNDLFAALEFSRAQGVGLDEFALAQGYVTQNVLYATLARVLRRPFVQTCVHLAQQHMPQGQITSGIVKIKDETQDYRFLVAPVGANLRFLLQNKSRAVPILR